MKANIIDVLRFCDDKKCLLFGVLPYVTLLMIVSAFVLLYHTPFYSSLPYQKHLDVSLNSLYTINHGSSDKECRFCNKLKQRVKRSDPASKNAAFNQSDNKWHKTDLHNKSSYGKYASNSSILKSTVGQQAICAKVENPVNATDIAINSTHICGILMEPVNVNYSRNIYFTVKTTHKFYTNRLFLLLLTWLQTVDKDKVNFSVIHVTVSVKTLHV